MSSNVLSPPIRVHRKRQEYLHERQENRRASDACPVHGQRPSTYAGAQDARIAFPLVDFFGSGASCERLAERRLPPVMMIELAAMSAQWTNAMGARRMAFIVFQNEVPLGTRGSRTDMPSLSCCHTMRKPVHMAPPVIHSAVCSGATAAVAGRTIRAKHQAEVPFGGEDKVGDCGR